MNDKHQESRDLFEYGRTVFTQQAFSALLGAELELFEPGKAVISIALRPELLQQHGIAHGGVISYLADNAMTFAGGSLFSDALTSEYKINFLRPATGEKLTATARVFRAGRSQAVCVCEVTAHNGSTVKDVAIAQGTIVNTGGKEG